MADSIFAPNLLRGSVALVTGGGSGIGSGIALRFAQHGARVALLGRKLEKLEHIASQIHALGGEALCLPTDVRNYDSVVAAVSATVEKFGGLDHVVNSAAGNFLAPAAALSANGFRTVIDIDLCGTFNTSRAAFEHLQKKGGSILSITATQAFVPTPFQCHAGAAKAGIEKLTRDLGLEWGRFGVRVNAIAPGPIAETEGMKRLAPDESEAKLTAQIPLGRFGSIDEVADAALYLVSPAAKYITGTTLLIDGGTSLLGAGPFLDLMK